MTNAIAITNLKKRCSDFTLNNINLLSPIGYIMGFLGDHQLSYQ